jgi:hypothetical protein
VSYTKTNSYRVPYEMFIDSGNNLQFLYSGSSPASDTFTGEFNPSWRSQVKAGTSATTTASGTRVILQPGFIDFSALMGAVDPNNHTTATYGVVGTPAPPYWRAVEQPVPDDVITEVTNRCIRKFLDAADSATSSIEFGQDLGEWKETVHGLIHPLQTLREFTFHHLYRVTKLASVMSRKRSVTKMIADTWLEFKFGWFPLAADVGKAYADFSNNRNHQNVQAISASARGEFTDYLAPNGAGGFSISPGVIHCDTRVTGYYFVTMKGAIRTGAHNGALKAAQMLQLDLPHFVPTAWDLLPYSWIVDYFVNVGDIFKGLCFQFSDLTWANKTIRTVHQYDWNYWMDLNNYSHDVQYLIARTDVAVNPSGTVTSFARTPLDSFDLIPQVRFSLPMGSVKPWENMAALLAGKQDQFSRFYSKLR